MALTIRESFFTGRGVGQIGTIAAPLAVEANLDHPLGTTEVYPLRLGFEATPQTQYLGFNLLRRGSIRAVRSSDDIYIVHVGVALIGPNDTRARGGFPLIHTAGGDSGWHDIDPGFWWICVSLGMQIDIQFDLTLHFRPQRRVLVTDMPVEPCESTLYAQFADAP
jgi:hypothetical protein